MSKPNKADLLARMTGAQPEVDGVLPIDPPPAKATPRPTSRRLTAQLSWEVWAVLDELPRSVSAAAFVRAAVLAVAADPEMMDAALDEAHADAKAARSRAT